MIPRLKWHRRRPGNYTAGPWMVRRYPYHRPVWELRKGDDHVANFDTAAGAKHYAADQQVNHAQTTTDQQ